ncbi:tetracenomycin A2 monooxygenase-dioxygenase [Asanoa hainanensis]|uniref:Tetracenomycin A2 monooxygenase-dioxygenase n=1 Tax=Asanoa hainanensis TaxID=560556 RepID=A0A239LCY0_9ACTN|nr:FAD-dependent monooxygenase [Asanoa hainanensis]SNT28507.1 tetracenomycin A2 monooxygenase-dioxygenase [Asanoa hainanensis]
MTIEVPVLIVGAGPAGLTSSLLLSALGVDSLLVERRATSSPLPRARGVHARAMEILRGVGLEAALRAVELPILPGAEWRARLSGPPLREDVPGQRTRAATSPCEGLSVAQDVFESVLAGHLTAPIRRGVALESFTTAPDGVRATLRDVASGHREAVHARWLIAADGARSGVRERLGITMQGPADLGRQWLVAFRADLTARTGPRPRGIYFLTESGAALVWTHPDHRWMISVPDSGGPPDVAALLGVPVEVLAGNPWTAAAQTASRYADGPVFLVGDAAHRFPPAGATGLSAAIHDAHNVAWKLAAVAHGHAGPALLDSYRTEREPVGARNAGETGAAWRRIFAGTGAPFAGRSLAQIDMGYQYRSAVVTSDGTPEADPPGADYEPTAAPGCRAPHLPLGDGRSTLDLFGREHTLLTAPPGDGWRTAAAAAGPRLGIPLSSHVIADPSWPTAYGTGPTGAVLVRPDGHVAWRHPGTGAGSELLAALTTAIAR